jgi:hypothetical protein
MLGPDYNPYQGTRSHSRHVALRLLCIVVESRPLLRFMQVTVVLRWWRALGRDHQIVDSRQMQ